MKANKIEHKNRLRLTVAAFVVVLLVVGLVACYGKLRSVYLEQCIIDDMPVQVEISAGKMVKADVIAENLGLRKGANLALIDFNAKREELLKKIPNLLSVRISRKLPDKVVVVAEERIPVARLAGLQAKSPSGRVIDTEGMVFNWQRGTQNLPIIREAQTLGTTKGQLVKGRILAALRLIETCRNPEFSELGVLEVDTSKRDFLVATLGNYSKLKILWAGMDEPQTPESKAGLVQRLTNLRDAIRARVKSNVVIWNATIPDRIFADTQEKP